VGVGGCRDDDRVRAIQSPVQGIDGGHAELGCRLARQLQRIDGDEPGFVPPGFDSRQER